MKKLSEIGRLEFDVLHFIVKRGPSTVGEVSNTFGEEHDYARTTVQTVMERLRQKGLLDREQRQGTYAYFPTMSKTAFYSDMVKDFVRETLSHDVSPIVAFLAESKGLTPEEEAVLRKIAERAEDGEADD